MIPLRNFKRFLGKAFQQPMYALGVFFRRLMAYFTFYAVADGGCFVPESITLFLTHRCNLRCKMCGQWGEAGVTKKENAQAFKEELSLEQYRKLLDDLTKVDRPSITLFGGEPLLYPACLDLVRYIKSKGIHCLMITNGSLLAGVAESLVEAGLDELNISLDGDGLLHDQIRGLPGLFEQIMNGIARVNAHKARLKRNKPLINLQCTITRYNYEHLEQMLLVAERAKANSLTFHNLIFLDRQALEKQKAFDQALGSSSQDWEGFVFEPGIDPDALWEKRKQILSKPYGFSIDFYPNFSKQELAKYYRDPCYQPARQNCSCFSPWLVAYIFPDGEIRPCLNFSYSFGNIKENRFLALWNGDRAKRFRIALKANKIFPVCARCTELYRY